MHFTYNLFRACCMKTDAAKYENEAYENPAFVQALTNLQKQLENEEYKKSGNFIVACKQK